jgi:hypothetical protein
VRAQVLKLANNTESLKVHFSPRQKLSVFANFCQFCKILFLKGSQLQKRRCKYLNNVQLRAPPILDTFSGGGGAEEGRKRGRRIKRKEGREGNGRKERKRKKKAINVF